MSDFVIEDGVLSKYTGAGGDVIIPAGVTEIGKSAFWDSCSRLTSITIPDSVTSIASFAFTDCTELRFMRIPFHAISGEMFGLPGKTIEICYSEDDGSEHYAVASFRKLLGPHSKIGTFFILPRGEAVLPTYDKLVGYGKYDGFQMNEAGRIKAALYRLSDSAHPVSEEDQRLFASFLTDKLPKVIKYVDEKKSVDYIRLLVEIGVVSKENKLKVQKLLEKASSDELHRALDLLETISE